MSSLSNFSAFFFGFVPHKMFVCKCRFLKLKWRTSLNQLVVVRLGQYLNMIVFWSDVLSFMIVGIVLNLQVTRLRLLGDHVHSTRIAFVEFAIVSFHLQPWKLFMFSGKNSVWIYLQCLHFLFYSVWIYLQCLRILFCTSIVGYVNSRLQRRYSAPSH